MIEFEFQQQFPKKIADNINVNFNVELPPSYDDQRSQDMYSIHLKYNYKMKYIYKRKIEFMSQLILSREILICH